MATLIQRSFTGGELDPVLHARVDTQKYISGLKTLRNMTIMKQGGAQSRPGTRFMAETRYPEKASRLARLSFPGGSLLLEIGDLYIRPHIIFQDWSSTSAMWGDPIAIDSATSANPGVFTTSAPHGLTTGQDIDIEFTGSGDDIAAQHFRVEVLSTTTFKLTWASGPNRGNPLDTSGYGAITDGLAMRILDVVTPYTEEHIADLQWEQSGYVVTFVHPSHNPSNFTYYPGALTADTSVDFSAITFAPAISAPGSLAVTGTTGSAYQWVVTAVAADTYEESLPQTPVGANSVPSSSATRTVSWAAVTGAVEYNVYARNGTTASWGLVAIVSGTSYVDTGVRPDVSEGVPQARNPFSGSDNRPSTVNYVQQRLFFGASNNQPETFWASRVGALKNFSISSPLKDSDSITATIAGRGFNNIKHILDLEDIVILTETGEWIMDVSAGISPFTLSLKQQSYFGASKVRPVVIGKEAFFVQARASVLRSLGFNYEVEGYSGTDATIFSAHLFRGRTIRELAYQQVPDSTVWVVRDDGVLLGMTYIREHQILGWHRHDTDGDFESVTQIAFDDYDAAFFVVKRGVNGTALRLIEFFSPREFSSVEDFVGMDSASTIDGRGYGLFDTVTLSGGTQWDETETLTLTFSGSIFGTDVVGKVVRIPLEVGYLDIEVTGYTAPDVVSGVPNQTVPVAMRTTAISTWSVAVDTLTGLHHLEGKSVAVMADGMVLASPYNPAYEAMTVTNGELSLGAFYTVVHVGLPYLCDVETLDIDTVNGSLIDRKKCVRGAVVQVHNSRGIWVGPKPPEDDAVDATKGLSEAKLRESEGYYSPVGLYTGAIEIMIEGQWNSNGRVFLRQVDPLPLTLLSIAPQMTGGR